MMTIHVFSRGFVDASIRDIWWDSFIVEMIIALAIYLLEDPRGRGFVDERSFFRMCALVSAGISFRSGYSKLRERVRSSFVGCHSPFTSRRAHRQPKPWKKFASARGQHLNRSSLGLGKTKVSRMVALEEQSKAHRLSHLFWKQRNSHHNSKPFEISSELLDMDLKWSMHIIPSFGLRRLDGSPSSTLWFIFC